MTAPELGIVLGLQAASGGGGGGGGGGDMLSTNNLSDVASVPTSRTNLGLGTMATENANAVAITGGTINGTPIGGTTQADGSFVMLNISGALQAIGGGADADLHLKPKGNGQVIVGVGGWAFNTQSSGAGSLFLSNGTNDAPNIKFAYGNNVNFSNDTNYQLTPVLGLTGQLYRFIINADEIGGALIGVMDISGNMGINGHHIAHGYECTDSAESVILISSGGFRYRINVSDAGVLSTTAV